MSDHGSLADRVRRTAGGPTVELPPTGHAWVEDGRDRVPGLLLDYQNPADNPWGRVLWAPRGPDSREEAFIVATRLHHDPLANGAEPVRKTLPTHVWVDAGPQQQPGLLIEWAKPEGQWWGRVLWAPDGPESGEENLIVASRLSKA